MRERNKKGLFITVEKTADGLGGTTQCGLLAKRLEALGYDVVLTKEPGGTELGKKLREIVLGWEGQLSNAAELFLFHADRAQHYKEVLKPALMAGKIVVCDRYMDSTIAYQGGGRGWRRVDLYRLHAMATGALLPDITFVLDGNPHRRTPNADRFETLDDGFFRRVRNEMLRVVKTSNRYVLVNADRPREEVADEIMGHVTRVLEGWRNGKNSGR